MPTQTLAFALALAGDQDVATLLPMMDDFNRIEEIPWSTAAATPALRKLLTSRDLGVVGLLREHGIVCGYFILTWGYDLEWNGRDAFLTELYLRPEARGRCLGRHALALLECLAVEHGARALHLMVRSENTPALRLYQGAGYEAPPRVFLTKVLGSP